MAAAKHKYEREIAAVKVPQFVVAMHAFIHLADYMLNRFNTGDGFTKS